MAEEHQGGPMLFVSELSEEANFQKEEDKSQNVPGRPLDLACTVHYATVAGFPQCCGGHFKKGA